MNAKTNIDELFERRITYPAKSVQPARAMEIAVAIVPTPPFQERST